MASSGGRGGNGTSTSEKNGERWGTTNKNEDKENMENPPRSVPCDGGSDDETTSDPIVVNAETTSLKMPRPMTKQNHHCQRMPIHLLRPLW